MVRTCVGKRGEGEQTQRTRHVLLLRLKKNTTRQHEDFEKESPKVKT
jgi:hypothetical protein